RAGHLFGGSDYRGAIHGRDLHRERPLSREADYRSPETPEGKRYREKPSLIVPPRFVYITSWWQGSGVDEAFVTFDAAPQPEKYSTERSGHDRIAALALVC